ncbi:MAG: hypothetical protein Q8O64_01390 [Sideroxyarcus sp.]|nr:hypothetical protein [Sideroxyarcus sp.]
MKLNKFALTLTAAALLPTLAYAAGDEVAASFERDLQRSFAIESPVAVAGTRSDPLDIVNTILNKETDAVVASFDRDLYREPVNSAVAFTETADPLDAINIAFGSVVTNAVLASFQRDLYREGANVVTVASGETDPLNVINVALWNDLGDKPAAHAAIVASHRHGG